MKYAIVLSSKHTGEEIHLGSTYESVQHALEAAEQECCKRCNYIQVVPVSDEAVWVGRKSGFQSKDKFAEVIATAKTIQAKVKKLHKPTRPTKEGVALTAIAISLLLAGWLDGQDHQMAQQYAVSIAGQKLACLSMTCGGGK